MVFKSFSILSSLVRAVLYWRSGLPEIVALKTDFGFWNVGYLVWPGVLYLLDPVIDLPILSLQMVFNFKFSS